MTDRSQPPTPPVVTLEAAARRLSKSRWQIRELVDAGRLPVATRLPGPKGAFLFAPADVERLAHELADEKEREAAELRGEPAAS